MKYKDNLNVIIVNDFDYIQGGASKVAIDEANILHKNGINTIFFSSTHEENDYKFKQVCTNQKECLKDGIKGLFRNLSNKKVKREFSKLLDSFDNKNTIIHVHGWTKSLSSVIFKVAKKKKFKLVLTVHDYFLVCPNGGFYNYRKNMICNKKPMCLKCITCNCDSRNFFFKIYRIIRQIIQNHNTKKLKNIKYIISISDFSIEKLKKYLDSNAVIKKIYNPIRIDKNKIINISKNNSYIYVGRVSQEKGVDIFCEAISKLKLNGIVVGDGILKENLEKKYSNIKFTGWVSPKEVEKYMRNSKALVFPSRWYEGAPLTILESVAIGLPCIVSNKCAGVDFIENNKNGLLYDGTVAGLIRSIKKYEKMDVKSISKYAYSKYWNNPFNEELHYKNLISYYEEIIKEEK